MGTAVLCHLSNTPTFQDSHPTHNPTTTTKQQNG